MNIKNILIDFVTVFAVSLVLLVFITFLWNLIFHDEGIIEWETSFRMAIFFGIILPWIERRGNKGN